MLDLWSEIIFLEISTAQHGIFLLTACLLSLLGISAQTEENPLDVSGIIKNAACQNSPGWTHHSGEASGTKSNNYAKNVPLFNSNDYSGTGIESWTASATTNTQLIYQNISLPAGTYVLDACVVAQKYVSDTKAGANNGGISLFFGDKEVECASNTWQHLQKHRRRQP